MLGVFLLGCAGVLLTACTGFTPAGQRMQLVGVLAAFACALAAVLWRMQRVVLRLRTLHAKLHIGELPSILSLPEAMYLAAPLQIAMAPAHCKAAVTLAHGHKTVRAGASKATASRFGAMQM